MLVLECTHHGLYEVSLEKIYEHLDFDEAIAFSCGSWELRSHGRDRGFKRAIFSGRIFDVFRNVLRNGFVMVDNASEIPDFLKQEHERLNPFKRDNLRERLAMVSAGEWDDIVRKLREPTRRYVFGCDYITSENCVWMRFQDFYPRKGKVKGADADEIARIISGYPSDFEPYKDLFD